MGHPLARLAEQIDWGFLSSRLGEVHKSHDGQPPLPIRRVVGLFILKRMHSLSDAALRALGGDPVFPVFPRRAGVPERGAVRPVIADALAPASGRGAACRVAPGEPAAGARNRSPGDR